MAVSYIKNYLTQNPYFRDGRYLSGSEFIGFFLHSVGCSQPDPNVFIRSWNTSSYTTAGINGFIAPNVVHITAPSLDKSGTVKRMPHAGSPANNHYIGFEMCEPKWLQYGSGGRFTVPSAHLAEAKAFVTNTYNTAVELFARLCLFHNKNPLQSKVILSHREGALLGIATNHGDPEHLWNGLGLGFTMDTFRKAVAAKMKEQLPGLVLTDNTNTAELFPTSTTYSPATTEIVAPEITAYIATIDRNSLAPNYSSLKKQGVVGVCIEAGYLYDSTHTKVRYANPKLSSQLSSARDHKMPVALFCTTRARSVIEAKEEIDELSYCVRTASPELGVWVKLKFSNSRSTNDAILDTYRDKLTRLGLKDRIGLYVTKAELDKITWTTKSNDWWLWIISHLSSVSSMNETVTPHTFALDELR